ncbi:unnamed protein product [Musa acuminata subsp. burmannicoides]
MKIDCTLGPFLREGKTSRPWTTCERPWRTPASSSLSCSTTRRLEKRSKVQSFSLSVELNQVMLRGCGLKSTARCDQLETQSSRKRKEVKLINPFKSACNQIFNLDMIFFIF